MMSAFFIFFGYMNFRGMDMASSLQLILAFALAGGVLVLILGSVATETSHVDNLFPLFAEGRSPGGEDFFSAPYGHPRALARFLRIRREQERTAVQAYIARLGIDQDLHLMRAGGEQSTQAGHERQRDDALAVIGQDDHIVRPDAGSRPAVRR